MKELYLEIKLKDKGGADIFITDKNYNALDEQKKIKDLIMFEEPYLIKTIVNIVIDFQKKVVRYDTPSSFVNHMVEQISYILNMNELKGIRVNFGATSNGDLIATSPRIVNIPRKPRPEYREMPSLDSLNYKMEDL